MAQPSTFSTSIGVRRLSGSYPKMGPFDLNLRRGPGFKPDRSVELVQYFELSGIGEWYNSNCLPTTRNVLVFAQAGSCAVKYYVYIGIVYI